MPTAPLESRATTAGKWLLAAVIPLSGLALGSVPPSALIVMSCLASISCALLWLERDLAISRASTWVLAVLGMLLAMTILQSTPMPASLAQLLAPANADIWDRALTPLREPGPSVHPLTIAPPATHVEVLRGFFYGCVFLAALRVTALEQGARFLTRIIIVSTVVMAISALGHAALEADKVFGIYRPHEVYAYQPGHYAPLLNTNHLSAYLNIGACVSLGALLSKSSIPRAISGSAVLVLAAMSVWQGSRGGAGSLLFGVLLVFALTFSRRRLESSRAGIVILAACAIAATLLVVVSYSEAASHFLSLQSMKGDVARRSIRLITASPWFGSGRGGFETVFSAVRQGDDYLTWTNPEDFVVHWLVEWGVPVSLMSFAMLGWALRPQLLLRAVRPAVGAWAAIVATVVHELVDYHLEVPGVVALVAVCAALVVSGRPTGRETARTSSARSARVAAFALAAGSLLAVIVVWPDRGHTLSATRRDLSAEAVDRSVPAAMFRDDIRAAMLRYPAEPFVPLMGAVRALSVDETSVVPWIGRSLERSPSFGRAHFVLARSLAPRNRAQARLEYRLAYEDDVGLRDAISREVLPLVDDPVTALEVVPEGPAGADMVNHLVAGLAARLPSTAVILDEELERRVPGSPDAVRRRVEAAVTDATGDAPWCVGRADCVDRALVAARELAAKEPEKCAPHVLVARVRAKSGDMVGALEGLELDAQKVRDHAQCQEQLIKLALEYNQTRRADAALDLLVRSGCGADAECIDLYGWAASMEEQRGHFVRAVRLYRRILELKPDREDLLVRIGELGDHDGLLTEGLEAYRTLGLLHPSDATYPARAASLRAHAHPAPIVLPSP